MNVLSFAILRWRDAYITSLDNVTQDVNNDRISMELGLRYEPVVLNDWVGDNNARGPA